MEHVWEPGERGVRNGKQGAWHFCSGCAKDVFFPDDASKFGRDIIVILAFMHDCFLLSKEDYHAKTVPGDRPDMDKGYHGQLAEDCDLARDFIVEYIMLR